MSKQVSIQKKHTAGAQSIGFDYQFYYFIFLLLQLKQGQKIGFEIRDDVHIEDKDGGVTLIQTKHSVQKMANGEVQNMTTLDKDLWKTLNNWAEFIKSGDSNAEKDTFILVTNKSENNNEFIRGLLQFKEDKNVKNIKELLEEIYKKTKNQEIQKHIQHILELENSVLKVFFEKIEIKINKDDIINGIKSILHQRCGKDCIVEDIWNKLYTNLHQDKYLDISNKKNFELSYEDFMTRYRNCFESSYSEKLPRRKLPSFELYDLDKQVFIRQLLDIDYIENENEIIKYTELMLRAFNDINIWNEEGYILSTDKDSFESNVIWQWDNEAKEKYRKIKKRINKGETIDSLEDEIKDLACEIVYEVRKKRLKIKDYPELDTEFSNGYFYMLSNIPKIGWHYDWENKYKKNE